MLKVFYLPSMALPWAVLRDKLFQLGIFLALWRCLLCSVAVVGLEEQKEDVLLAACGISRGFGQEERKNNLPGRSGEMAMPSPHAGDIHPLARVLPLNEEAAQRGP